MEFAGVSIRFRHPTRSLAFLSDVLGLETGRTWLAGAPKQTPIGTPLKGVYENSHWYSRIEFEPRGPFRSSLERAVGILVEAEATVRELQATGGTVELYVTLAGWVNNSGVISADLMRTMADLGIELDIEVFPD